MTATSIDWDELAYLQRAATALRMVAESYSCGDDCSDRMKLLAQLGLGIEPDEHQPAAYVDELRTALALACGPPL